MSDLNRVMCSHCGGKVPIPPGHTRAKIRCGSCGYYADVPPNLRASEEPSDGLPTIQPKKPADETREENGVTIPSYFDDDAGTTRPRKPQRNWGDPEPDATPVPPPKKPKATARPNPNPKDIRPDFQVSDEAPRGPNLIEGTQEEHDDQAIPYTVPGDGMKRCPDCGTNLPYEATLCVHCGVEFGKKKKKKKTFETINREWEPRLPFTTRLKIFGGLQVFNVFFLIFIRNVASFDHGLVLLVFLGSLQAFLLGSFEKIAVLRNTKGQTTLTKIWRIGFIPLAPMEMKWKERHGIGVITGHAMGCIEWFTFACLLMLLIVPGVLFYFLVLNPVRYNVVLCDVYGSTEERLFTTTHEDTAHEICDVLATATGLTNRGGT
jgi:hypothetical protein